MGSVKLTKFSPGGGCGCKLSPSVLQEILKTEVKGFIDPYLLVGNDTRDDAAVYDLKNGTSIISTTDFFTPIVDDPYDFGRVAATNAISDIYAMGGRPIMAIAILGWPVKVLPARIASKVIEGARSVCAEAQIVLAGGHSIDITEPIFGLAVTGTTSTDFIKRNNTAKPGHKLILTKPLGIGVLSQAEKKSMLKQVHRGLAIETMCRLNSVGQQLSELDFVSAMTDVTGFGLAGHLVEMCEGAGLTAKVDFEALPVLPGVYDYIGQGCLPGGTQRNFDSYGEKITHMTTIQRALLCDPQTSGGLLVAVEPNRVEEVLLLLNDLQISPAVIGQFENKRGKKRAIHII